jgi:anthranilate synthase/aminodeoxychorismate synthase-like glutamine amidotransferase
MSKREILLIDNLDSFSFNLVESFQRLGCTGRTLRHSVAASDALAIAQERKAVIVLSPGPGKPEDAGCCTELIALAKGKVPLLGICLGHQAIVKEAGGTICRAPEPVHGKTSLLEHDGHGAFQGLPNPVRIGRYHSLCTRDLPNRFIVHAHIDGMAMGISDPDAMQTGIQFHPESILTTHGDRMLANILDQAFAPA